MSNYILGLLTLKFLNNEITIKIKVKYYLNLYLQQISMIVNLPTIKKLFLLLKKRILRKVRLICDFLKLLKILFS